jgi:hypothetical protein
MYRLRRFGVVRTATVVGLMYAVLVAVILIPILLVVGAVGLQTDLGTGGPAVIGEPGSDPGGGAAGAGAAGIAGLLLIGLLAALFYGIIGWVFTAIACLTYNLVARWTGGIEVQVVQAPPPAPRAMGSAAARAVALPLPGRDRAAEAAGETANATGQTVRPQAMRGLRCAHGRHGWRPLPD